ncbi:alpha/beta hydrolase family protein [Spirillospora sp. CA-294931]|uniref:alpha/beta hydrolase family protein n=1 Tax=Spirillospora sp. CA-294931 TaxID=3240042 RepID=UPI003D94D92F
MLRLTLLATALTATLASPVAAAETTDWSKPGPHATAVETGPVNTLYYPKNIAQSTRRHPVIVWGNGTGAVPGVYRDLLAQWASHGFIVSAANTPMSNSGVEMRAGIDDLAKRDKDTSSKFHGRVDLEHIGASGHSQGGAAAIVVGADPRVDTILPVQPGPLADIDKVHGPAFLMAGQNDTTVRPAMVKAFYDDADHIPAIYGEVRDADHFTPVGDPGPFTGPTTAWFRFQLMNDPDARTEFYGPNCGICTDTKTWSETLRNPLVP